MLTRSTSTRGISIYSKNETFLNIAEQLSTLGTCDRKHVGALITHDGRCVSWGYNGWLDYPNQPGNHVHVVDMSAVEKGCRNATHAEANALAFAARQGISTDGGTLYVTVSPCDVCARLLIAAGIDQVFYLEEYRDRRGIEILQRAGITCVHGSRNGGATGTPWAV